MYRISAAQRVLTQSPCVPCHCHDANVSNHGEEKGEVAMQNLAIMSLLMLLILAKLYYISSLKSHTPTVMVNTS